MCCELRLKPLRRTKRGLLRCDPQPLQTGQEVNQGWALDFMHNVLHDGRRFRTLNAFDEANRERLGIEIATSFPARRLIPTLGRLIDW